MTSNIISLKRDFPSPSPEPKRQKTASSLTDQRIQEILNHRTLIKHHRDLLVRWHELAGKEISKQLKRTQQSPKWTVTIDPDDSFLHLSIKMKDYPLIKALVIEHPQGEHSFYLAISLGDQKIQSLFAEHGLQDDHGNTILHILFGNRIAEGQTPPDFAPFEEVNPDLTLENSEGKTCYELAAENFHRKSFRRMMAFMESKGQRIPPSKVLSERATTYKEPQILDVWVRHMMEQGSFQLLGSLAQVSRQARKEAREALIQKACQIGCKERTYKASLHFAKKLKHELTNVSSTTTLDTLHTLDQEMLCSYLSDHSLYLKSSISENPLFDLLSMASTWKNLGMLPLERSEIGAEAVCYAVLYNKFELLKHLLEHGYPVISCKNTIPREDGDGDWQFQTVTRSPLHIAVELNRYKMIPLLIEAGVNLTERYFFKTPLEIANLCNSTEAAQLLSDALELADQINPENQ